MKARMGYVVGGVTAIAFVSVGSTMINNIASHPKSQVEIGGYATTLVGRTESQRHNARLAAEELNGKLIPPGGTFSFNKTVHSWSMDRGYVKAPVSYDGELVRAFGGGVCQTSTTLYNAALIAGLPILERHPHVFAAHYVPPGQDAAVAHPGIDLRFKNPYRFPIRIVASAVDDRVEVRMYGAKETGKSVTLSADVLSTSPPANTTRITSTNGKFGYTRNPGSTGYRVVTYRNTIDQSGKKIRERLSDDTYQAMDRLIRVTE